MILENELIQDTRDATHYVTQEGQFNFIVGNLLMRNMAFAANCLDTPGFHKLSHDAVSLVIDVANMAKIVAPMNHVDLRRLPNETNATYSFRTNIAGPLESLERDLKVPHTDTTKIIETQIALAQAGRAVEAIITETALIAAPEFLPMQVSVNHLASNARAAVRHAERDTRYSMH